MKTILLSMLAVLMLLGCGYQMGYVFPTKTIAVPIFQNKTLYRGYEFTLSRSIVADILTRTPMRVVDRAKADTLLTGEIHKVTINSIIKDENRNATELDVTVMASVQWQDLRTGKIILPKKIIGETIEISVNKGENLDDAISRALSQLSRAIIYEMEDCFWQDRTGGDPSPAPADTSLFYRPKHDLEKDY